MAGGLKQLFVGPRAAIDGATFMSVPCARTGSLKRVLVQGGGLFELLRVGPATPASVLVDEQVVSSGALLLAAPYDVLFLLLPLLTTEGTSWEAILQRAVGHSQLVYVLRAVQKSCLAALQAVCDVSSAGVYLLNKERASAVLKIKVERLGAALHAKAHAAAKTNRLNSTGFSTSSVAIADTASGAVPCSETSTSALGGAIPTPDHHIAAALACVCEYLNEAWATSLEAACGWVRCYEFLELFPTRKILSRLKFVCFYAGSIGVA
jgi:hypothetical protein